MFAHSLWLILGSLALAQEPTATPPQEPTPPPVEEPQPVPTGTLNVTATAASTVYVDHQIVGTTPLKIDLPTGKHLIRIVADGYDPFVRRVRITPDMSQNLNGALSPGGGTVEFASPIPKATISIDGGETQTLPIRLKNLNPGEHSWTMDAPRHEEKSGSLVFSQGQNLYLYTTLDSSAGLATFDTTPAGASIFMKSTESSLGTTPYNMEGLTLDTHTVLLQAKGYAAAFRKMDNRDGEKGIVKTKLSKFGANVTISTNRSDAVVKIENIEVGFGKKVSLGKIERGIYNLIVTTPDGASASARMNVPTSGSIHFKAKLFPSDSENKSRISILPPLWNQWYFWAGVGGAVAITGASAAIINDLNQPKPAPKGDVSVSLP